MDSVRKLRTMIQGDPQFMRKINGWLTIFWVCMIPVSLAMGWLSSVTYVSALSLWALVSGHWAAWQASRTEVEQQREENRDTEGKIVRRIIKETNLKPSKSKAKP
jgi:uncharacterized membrane protein